MVKTTTVSDRLRSLNFRSWLKKISLVNAFAIVSLHRVTEFHLWPLSTSTPNYPYQSLPSHTKLTKLSEDPMLPFHAIKFTTHVCFKHSPFFKVMPLRGVPAPKYKNINAIRKWSTPHPAFLKRVTNRSSFLLISPSWESSRPKVQLRAF